MAQDINLLIQKEKGFFSTERLLFFSRAGAIASVVIVLSLSILFFLLSRDSSIVAVKLDESKTLAQLTLVQDKIAKYLVVLDRVQKIQLLNKGRSSIATNLASLTQQVPSGVTVTDFVLDSKTVSISLSSTDLSQIGKAIDNYTSRIA